jgi:hypothetical protein
VGTTPICGICKLVASYQSKNCELPIITIGVLVY